MARAERPVFSPLRAAMAGDISQMAAAVTSSPAIEMGVRRAMVAATVTSTNLPRNSMISRIHNGRMLVILRLAPRGGPGPVRRYYAWLMHTARLRSVRGRLIPSVEAIAQGVVERAIEFMVSRLNMNALLAQADLNAALDQVDINELLARVDIQKLADRVDVDRLVAGMDVKSLEAAQKVLTKQLLLRRRQAQTPPGTNGPSAARNN
jgi:hypothetical protein